MNAPDAHEAADARRFRWWTTVDLASPAWDACARLLPRHNPTTDDYRRAIDAAMACDEYRTQ